MDLKGMQQMWPEMDPDTVKFIFNLFDTDGSGKIDAQEFVMAVRAPLAPAAQPASADGERRAAAPSRDTWGEENARARA